MLAFLCALSFYNLVTSPYSKTHMNNEVSMICLSSFVLSHFIVQNYTKAFVGSILAFVEGLLFAYFTFDLLSEQMTTIEENQGYIDEVKKVYGKQ